MKSAYYILLAFLLSSCVSIERDIYFKNPESSELKSIGSSRPGSSFESSPIKVKDQYDREVYLNITNHAEGSYLWGVVIPILPVFFLPQMKFSLDSQENLKIRCNIDVHYGPQYLKKWEKADNRDLYILNEEGVKLAEMIAKTDKDTCSLLRIQLPNGQSVSPTKIEFEDKSMIAIFTFAIPAASLSEFSIIINEIKLFTGENIKTDIKFRATVEDWTRYYMIPIAP